MNKRLVLSFMCLIALLTLTVGCEKKEEDINNNNNNNTQEEEKKLVCSMSEEEESYKEEIKYTINYKGDSYDKITVMGTMKYNSGKFDETDANELADVCNADNKSAKGVSCNVQRSGSSIWVTYQFTMADLDEAGKTKSEEFGIDEFGNKKYDELKSLMETAGFKCE